MASRKRAIDSSVEPPVKVQKTKDEAQQSFTDSALRYDQVTDQPLSQHATELRHNFKQLVETLQPQLFLRMLDDCIKCKIDEDMRKKEKNRRLLDMLMRFPRQYFEQFCDVIAGLHPDLFELLKKRKPTYEESTVYLNPFVQQLKHSVLQTGSKTDNQIDPRIDLDTQFVSLKLVNIVGNKYVSPSHFVNEDNILPDDYQNSIQDRHKFEDLLAKDIVPGQSAGGLIILTGRAGVGKSTLTQYVYRLWANGQLDIPQSVIFLLNLRKLVRIEREITFTQLLGMYSEYLPRPLDQNQPVLPWIINNQEKMMFFMDGVDELEDISQLFRDTPELELNMKATPLDWCVNLMRRTTLQDSTLMLISRPFSSLSELKCTRKVDVLGLTVEKVMKFIELNVKAERQDIVKQTLSKNPVLLSICSITFYCAAICSILEEDENIDGESLTTYTRITAFIVTRLAMRRGKKQTKAALMSDDLHNSISHMASLAHAGIPSRKNQMTRLIFNEDDFTRVGFLHDKIRSARNTGLLTCSDVEDPLSEKGQPKLQAEFAHLSIQELLAAAQMRTLGDKKISSFLRNLSSSSGRFNMHQLFMFGLLLDKHNKYIKGINHAVTAHAYTIPDATTVRVCEAEKAVIDVHRQLCKQSEKEMKSHSILLQLQTAYESQTPELAKTVASSIAPLNALDLESIQLTAVDMKALFFTVESTPIESVSLESIAIDDAAAWEIRRHLETNKLKHLCLTDTELSDEGMKHICEGIKSSSTLEEICFRNNILTSTGMASLADALAVSKSLTQTILARNLIAESGYKQFADGIKKSKTLRRLEILENSIEKNIINLEEMYDLSSNNELKCFIDLTKGIQDCIPLTTIYISHMPTGGMKHLAGNIRASSNLKQLIVSSTNIAEDDMGHLVNTVIKSKGLDRLEIISCKMDAAGMKILADAVTTESGLRHLSLSNILPLIHDTSSESIKIGDFTHLADAIRVSNTLKSLKLDTVPYKGFLTNPFQDALLQNKSLQNLQLSGYGFKDPTNGLNSLQHFTYCNYKLYSLALKPLRDPLTNKSLDHVVLCRNRGNSTANRFDYLFHNQNVVYGFTKLQLIRNGMRGCEMNELAKGIISGTKVQYLQFAYCGFTTKTVRELHEAIKDAPRTIHLQLVNNKYYAGALELVDSLLPDAEVLMKSLHDSTDSEVLEGVGQLFSEFVSARPLIFADLPQRL